MLNLFTTQKVTLHAKPKNELGEDVRNFAGKFVWAVSDNVFGTLIPTEDTLHCDFITSGAAGDCVITATVDALVGSLDIHIDEAPAVSVVLENDAPVVR